MMKLIKRLPLTELLLLFIVSYCLYLLFNKIIDATVNCDIGWLIYAAKGMSQGKVLYKDLYEINPPLIFSFHYLSNYIADLFGANYELSFNAFVFSVMLGIFFLSLVIIKPLLNTSSQKILLVLGLFTNVILYALNRAIYGEREHLFVMLVTPYILHIYLSIKRQNNSAYTWLVYLLALFGFILKPFYLVFFCITEGVLLTSKSKTISERRLIYCSLAGLIIIYIGAVYLITPSYFTEILPIGLKTYYGHRFNTKIMIADFIENITPIFFLLLLISFSDGLIDLKARRLWLGLITASVLLPLIQFKGWPYTYYPLQSFCFLASIMIASEANLLAKLWVIIKRAGKTNVSEVPLHSVFTYGFLALGCLAIVSNLFMELNSTNLYLQPFTLYFVVFLGLIFKNQRAFKSNFSVLLAIIAIVFFALYPLHELAFLLTFLASPSLISVVCLILIIGAISGLKIKFDADGKVIVMIIAILSLCGFYERKIDSNIYDMNNIRGNDLAYGTLEKIVMSQHPPVKNIFIFNTDLYPAFPLVNYTNVGWGTRFHHLWMLPAIYEKTTATNPCYVEDKFINDRNYIYQAIYDDLKKSSPELLMFDVSPQIFLWKEKPYFEWHECIRQANPELNNFIKHDYSLIKKINYCFGDRTSSCAFEVYKKRKLNKRIVRPLQ